MSKALNKALKKRNLAGQGEVRKSDRNWKPITCEPTETHCDLQVLRICRTFRVTAELGRVLALHAFATGGTR